MMPFVSKRAKPELSIKDIDFLLRTALSKTESLSEVHWVKILLAYHQGGLIDEE